jgi:hypothetical protein
MRTGLLLVSERSLAHRHAKLTDGPHAPSQRLHQIQKLPEQLRSLPPLNMWDRSPLRKSRGA